MSSFLFFCSVLLLATASHGIKHKHLQVSKGNVKNPLSFTLPAKQISVLDKIDASKMKQLDETSEHFELLNVYEANYPNSPDVESKVCGTTPAVEPDSVSIGRWCFPLADDDYYRSLGYSYQGGFTTSAATLSEPGQLDFREIYFQDSSTCDLKNENGFVSEGRTILAVSGCFVDADGDLSRQLYSTSRLKDADENVFPYFFGADSKSLVFQVDGFENDPECKGNPIGDGSAINLFTISSNCRQSMIYEDDLYVAYKTSFYDERKKEAVYNFYDNARCEGNARDIDFVPIKECFEEEGTEGFTVYAQKPFSVIKGNTESTESTESVQSTESVDKDFFDTSEDGTSSTGTVKLFMVIGLVVLVASSVAAFCICKQSKTKDCTTNHDEVEFIEL